MTTYGFLLSILAAGFMTSSAASQQLMPRPASVVLVSLPAVPIDSSFTVHIAQGRDARVERAVQRFVKRLALQTAIPFTGNRITDEKGTLTIRCEDPATGRVQQAIEDESYTITSGSGEIKVAAKTYYGLLRAIETLLQLVEIGPDEFQVPALQISDAPRFPWRGLLIDACRHWMPVEVIKRNIDGLAMVKMNVLHWHLSEDQGFRVESKVYPKLHEMGSEGNYYTQDQIREVVEYAAERGIRVVPEFDIPGHTTAWFVGYPELASAPGPYTIERKWGIHDPTMDPTREDVYTFLDRFIGEMVPLFPDHYFHIGGDEVTGKQWDANPSIQEFMKKNNHPDNHALQAYFNRRILAILQKYNKKMIGWDEIFHPDLPKDIVIHSWRGQKSLAESSRRGYQGILSYGYYLDHIRPASFHYAVDPIDSTIATLSREEQSRILGGEACMWAEYVSYETIDSRIWPRTAAIAERLWSPASVKDIDDMYARLDIMTQRLEWAGLTHRSSYHIMLERLTGGKPVEPLKVLADVVEPVKGYQRGRTRPHTSLTPLNRLVDAARPESDTARVFSGWVDKLLSGSITEAQRNSLRNMLRRWRDNDAILQPYFVNNGLMPVESQLSIDLADIGRIGLRLLEVRDSGKSLSATEQSTFKSLLEEAEKQKGALLIMVAPPVKRLYEAMLK